MNAPNYWEGAGGPSANQIWEATYGRPPGALHQRVAEFAHYCAERATEVADTLWQHRDRVIVLGDQIDSAITLSGSEHDRRVRESLRALESHLSRAATQNADLASLLTNLNMGDPAADIDAPPRPRPSGHKVSVERTELATSLGQAAKLLDADMTRLDGFLAELSKLDTMLTVVQAHAAARSIGEAYRRNRDLQRAVSQSTKVMQSSFTGAGPTVNISGMARTTAQQDAAGKR